MPGATDSIGLTSGQEWLGATSLDTPFINQGGAITGSFVSDAGTFVLAETALDMHCWGENPVVTAKLQLHAQRSGLDR